MEILILSELVVLALVASYFIVLRWYKVHRSTKIHSERLMRNFIADDFDGKFEFLDAALSPEVAKDFRRELEEMWANQISEKSSNFDYISTKQKSHLVKQYHYALKFKGHGAVFFIFEYHKIRNKWAIRSCKPLSYYEYLYERAGI